MSGTNSVSIKVTDNVAQTIAPNIQNIGKAAKVSQTAIDALNNSLSQIKPNAFDTVLKSASSASQTLVQATAKLNQYSDAALKSAKAQQELAQAESKTQQALSRAAKAASDAQAAASRAAIAATNETIANERLATAIEKTAKAKSEAALAALKLKQAQEDAKKSGSGLLLTVGNLYSKLILLTGGSLAIGALSSSFIKLSDSYQLMENRLQNVSTSQAQVTELMSRLKDVANDTRVPIDDTVNAFQRFDRALREQGASQEESIRFTKTLNELLAMSGDTTQEATAATIQLSQAFNAGKLQGNDFHSVASELPSVLDAIAKRMGVNVASLKTLSTQGKITSDIMRSAFADVAKSTDDLYSKHLPTVQQAFVVLGNTVKNAVGEFNESSGITKVFASSILTLAGNFDTVQRAGAAAILTLGAFFSAAILTNTTSLVGKLTTAIKALGEAEAVVAAISIATNPWVLLTTVVVGAGSALYEFSDKIKPLGDGLTTLSDIGKVVFGDIEDYITSATDKLKDLWDYVKDIGSSVANYINKFASNNSTAAQQYQNYLKERNATLYANNNFKANPSYLDDVENRAANNAGLEAAINGYRQTNLRPSGQSHLDTQPDKSAQKRADALSKVNLQLDNELSRINMLKPAREVQQKFDQIEQELASKKITLNEQETKTIKDKLQAIQEGTEVQSKLDSAYEESTGALRDYNNTLKALDILLKQGSISQNEFSRQTAVANENYKASSDYFYTINKNLDQQQKLLSYVGDELSVNQQIQQISNQLTSKYGTEADKEAEKFRTKIELMQQLTRVQSQYNTIYDNTIGLQKDGVAQIQAANDAQAKGLISGDIANAYRIKGQGSISSGRLQSGNYSASDIVNSTAGKMVSDYNGIASGFSDSMGSFFNSFSNSFGDTVSKVSTGSQTIKSALKSIGSDAIGSLISSLARLAAQYVVVQSITGLTNLFGGSVFGSTGSLATSVSSSGWAGNVTAMKFANGGYTGSGGKWEEAGTVHKGEYVVDADTTSKVGVPVLDSLRAMAKTGSSTRSTVGTNDNRININMGGIVIDRPNVTDGKLDQKTMERLNKSIEDTVLTTVNRYMTNQQRPGGMLNRG